MPKDETLEVSEEEVLSEEVLAEAEEIEAKDPESDAAKVIAKLRKENARTRVKKNEITVQYEEAIKRSAEYEKQLAELGTQLDELRAGADKTTESFNKLLEELGDANSAVIATLPEEAQALVPGGLDALSLRKWLDTAVPVLTKRPAKPPLSAEDGASKRGSLAPVLNEDELIIANRLGLSPEEYAKHKR